MTDPTPPHDEAVDRALTLAQSDAEVEREEGIAWLLAHPDDARPVLCEEVRSGRGSAPELLFRILAALDGQPSVDALEAALLRGNEGEAFYAAVALAECGPAGAAALRRHEHHPDAPIREAVALALLPPRS